MREIDYEIRNNSSGFSAVATMTENGENVMKGYGSGDTEEEAKINALKWVFRNLYSQEKITHEEMEAALEEIDENYVQSK